ncbi:MAG: cyclic nucleotide-binding domain-containing protein [Pseudomonadota bacterium]
MSITIQRPQRWDQPFDPEMCETDVDHLLTLPPLSDIDPENFPNTASLRDILRNDTRLQSFHDGDIIMREGDYGSSAFLILSGAVRVIIGEDLPASMLGRGTLKRRGLMQAFSQLWSNSSVPERRDASHYENKTFGTRGEGGATRVFLQDVPGILDEYRTVRILEGELVGEIAALGRTPRTATVFADGETEVLEIRWQGLRDLRRRADSLREHIDRLYRERSLTTHLRNTPMFSHLDDAEINEVADQTLFETYGEFDWYGSYKTIVAQSAARRLEIEPIIAHEDHYVDGLIMIRAGFARISMQVNHGHRTLTYLQRGDTFGFDEIAHHWRTGERLPSQSTLRAIGYVDVLRVPTHVIEKHVLPSYPPEHLPPLVAPRTDKKQVSEDLQTQTGLNVDMLESLVENRYINGTAAMVIDLNRCVGCDDCVRACSRTHDNNPRFIRHGKQINHYMIANACMHCSDPVCMIGCPTGAIHRDASQGQVIINDETCIGCATCANSCPYDNIRMVEIRDQRGTLIRDQQTNAPIIKATKCDLCVDQVVSPACANACPHDALARLDLSDYAALNKWFDR